MIDRPNHAEDAIRITSARTCLPIARAAVWPDLARFVTQMWTTHVLLAEPPRLFVCSVSAAVGSDPDGWLTWTLDALSRNDTLVTVSLSEQNDGAPEPELDLLLCRLVARCIGATLAHPQA